MSIRRARLGEADADFLRRSRWISNRAGTMRTAEGSVSNSCARRRWNGRSLPADRFAFAHAGLVRSPRHRDSLRDQSDQRCVPQRNFAVRVVQTEEVDLADKAINVMW